MKTNYKVRVSKLSKYHGETNENHKNGKIHEEEYNYIYFDYKEALDAYKEHCVKTADFLSLPLNFWTQTCVIQLIDNSDNNPQKPFEHLGLTVRQLTLTNL